MRRMQIFSLITIFSLFVTACEKDSPGSNDSITQILTSGGWHVSLFSERGSDETSDFNGWNFTFQADGKLIAAKAGNIRQGTWSESGSSNKLIIDLGAKTDANKPLGELTDDWIIVARAANKISVTDNNSTREELLEFTKH